MRRKDKKLFRKIIIGIFYLSILPILIITIIIKHIVKNKKKGKETKQEENHKENKYQLKQKTITENEKYFLNIIRNHFNNYDIRFQVPLSSIIEKQKDFENQYQNELNRIIDIGIFDNVTTTPLLLIEINDSTHHRQDRKARDLKVKDICNQADIKLITFWTEYENKEEYIVNRIKKELEDSNN